MINNEFDAFNFDTMKEAVGIDPFAKASNKYATDERFYTLKKDKEGNGAVLVRFLPDSEKRMILPMYKINTTVIKNGKKRFVNEFTPATINQPCPFQEEWQRLWNEDKKEESRMFGRSAVYIANIKIINDPGNPENNGKVFLYQFSGAINKKLENALKPSETDIALGKSAKQIFNPLAGNSFRLVAQKGANGQINYDASEVVPEVDGIYTSVEEAINDIKENTFKLGDFLKPDSFMSYEELTKKFKWVTWADQAATAQAVTQEPVVVAQVPEPAPEVVPEPIPAEPTPTNTASASANASLDSLLDGLVK